MSPMFETTLAAPSGPARRIVAALVTTLLLAMGLSTATASAVSAGTTPPVGDEYVTVSWRPFNLLTDVNNNGRPDPGDLIATHLEVVISSSAPGSLTQMGVSGSSHDWQWIHTAAPGADLIMNDALTVTAAMLNSLGSGPAIVGGTFSYTMDGVGTRSFALPTPPLFYTAPAPLTQTTSFDYVLNHGTAPDALVEGDQVRYVTHVTNTSAVALTLTGTGYASPAFPATLAAGDSVDLYSGYHTITYDDMKAGKFTCSDASVAWDTGDASGAVTVKAGSVGTAPIAFSATYGLDAVVNTSAGVAVPLGDAVAGNVIDYTFQLTNTGNTVVGYLSFTRLWSGGGTAGEYFYGSVATQGQSVPSSAAPATRLMSRGGTWPAYTLTQADIARGYVDLPFTTTYAPSYAMYGSNPRAYSHGKTQRVMLRSFTTSATITASSVLNDANGDGYGQPGETVTYSWRVVNTSDQAITLTRLSKKDAWTHAVSGVGAGAPDGAVIAKGGELSGTFTYMLTSNDLDNGVMQFAVLADIKGNADGATTTVSASTARVILQDYEAPLHDISVSATYVDANGDGKANIGETVTVTTGVTVFLGYPLTGIVVTDGPVADATGLLPAFPTSIEAFGKAERTFTHVLTATDLARGHFSYNAKIAADGATTTTSGTAAIPVVAYVAPASTLTTEGTYDDANGDGHPSIGEKVTVTTTVKNTGTYPLMGVLVTDAAGSSVTGLQPTFPGTVAAGASATETFDHVLTAADFARGTFDYAASMTAEGVAATTSGTSVHLTGITFQAYEADLTAGTENRVSVCGPSGAPTTAVTLGTGVMVSPGTCGYPGAADGFRVVAFSTPMLIGTGTFHVTLPNRLGAGAHRLALYAPDGTLVGWKAVTASDPASYAGALASTGVNALPLGGAASALVLIGAAGILAGTRRRTRWSSTD